MLNGVAKKFWRLVCDHPLKKIRRDDTNAKEQQLKNNWAFYVWGQRPQFGCGGRKEEFRMNHVAMLQAALQPLMRRYRVFKSTIITFKKRLSGLIFWYLLTFREVDQISGGGGGVKYQPVHFDCPSFENTLVTPNPRDSTGPGPCGTQGQYEGYLPEKYVRDVMWALVEDPTLDVRGAFAQTPGAPAYVPPPYNEGFLIRDRRQ
ncbi:hypothetical protein C8J57DRAFT_1229590 [Mycena rebaudengoi]|nr:hypothetical protein C8J57DRAFT_1229590 [Mycena rebaudengoi]